jgi:hypothetical protein
MFQLQHNPPDLKVSPKKIEDQTTNHASKNEKNICPNTRTSFSRDFVGECALCSLITPINFDQSKG